MQDEASAYDLIVCSGMDAFSCSGFQYLNSTLSENCHIKIFNMPSQLDNNRALTSQINLTYFV